MMSSAGLVVMKIHMEEWRIITIILTIIIIGNTEDTHYTGRSGGSALGSFSRRGTTTEHSLCREICSRSAHDHNHCDYCDCLHYCVYCDFCDYYDYNDTIMGGTQNCTGEYVPKDHMIMTTVMIVMVMNVD